MKIVSTKIHGVLDYTVAAILIATPWLLGFTRGGAETWVFVVQGAVSILYSLVTNYERGVIKILPMKMHLGLDIIAGLVLATSPWIFGFEDYVFVPHLLFGIGEVLVALITEPMPRKHPKQPYDMASREPR